MARINRAPIGTVEAINSPQRLVLDMHSTEIPVYVRQERSAYNGHFESTCYPAVISIARAIVSRPTCGPAAFTPPRIGKNRRCPRLSASGEWARKWCFGSIEAEYRGADDASVREASYKPMVWCKGFLYQAASWKKARRVVAKMEFHFGELSPRVGFIVTNLEIDSRVVVRFYNKRGTAQWIEEGKQAVKTTLLNCQLFRSNEVRLWLSVIASNLGNPWRRPVLPRTIDNRSLTRLQQRSVKRGGRLIKHTRYYRLLLAESHLTQRMYGSMLRRISLLPMSIGGRRLASKQAERRRGMERCLGNHLE